MISAVLFITFFVLLILNIPIAICLGLSSVATIFWYIFEYSSNKYVFRN